MPLRSHWAVKQANRCCERRAPVCMQQFLFHYMAFLHFLQTPNTNDILKVFRMWLLACVLWFFFIVVVATLFIMYMCVSNPFIKCYYGCFCYCRQRTMDRQARGELCWKQKQAYIYMYTFLYVFTALATQVVAVSWHSLRSFALRTLSKHTTQKKSVKKAKPTTEITLLRNALERLFTFNDIGQWRFEATTLFITAKTLLYRPYKQSIIRTNAPALQHTEMSN